MRKRLVVLASGEKGYYCHSPRRSAGAGVSNAIISAINPR